MAREAVSEATTTRLSILLRCVIDLEAQGLSTASSHELAARFGLNSAQIRKDLAQFGEFGVRGVGYRIPELKKRLRHLLALDRQHVVVIAGAGYLGQALADSKNFDTESFRVMALFDVDGRKVGGRSRTGVPILDAAQMPEALRSLRAEIGILAVPPANVREAGCALARGGVKAILNFAAAPMPATPGVIVKNVDLTLFLEGLSYQLGARAH